jgi:hypothetical protein
MAQQTSVDLLLTKIPNAAEIKEFISNNDADEKMLDEWLFERIYKGVDYKETDKQQKKYFFHCGRQYQLTGKGTFTEVYTETYKSE